jgi:hypothetical protein
MSGRTEIEQTLDGYLAEGPESVPDHALMRALDAIDRTSQRRDLLAPWRFTPMNTYPRLAAAVLVAIVAIGGAGYLVGQRAGATGTSPTPTPTTAPSPTPSAVAAAPTPTPAPDTSTWRTFTSAMYGFSAAYPQSWSEQPATGKSASKPGGEANPDIFWSPSGWPEFAGFEVKVRTGATAESVIQAHVADGINTACVPTLDRWTPTTIDGHSARVAYGGCNEHFYSAEAVIVIGRRIWYFDLYGPDRSLIVPFLTTVKIDPTKVVD